MQGIHIALTVATVFAVIATVWGVSTTPSDAADGVVSFVAQPRSIEEGPLDVAADPVVVQLETPANATRGTLVVTLAWSGPQPVPMTVTVDALITTPNGSSVQETLTWTYSPAGPTTASFDVDLGAWADTPASFAGTLDDASPFTLTWPVVNATLARTDAPQPGIGQPGQLVATLELQVETFEAMFTPANEGTGGP